MEDEVFSIEKYHSILCSEVPDFLYEYISFPSLQRLNGIGLLCGTDWTPLFHNHFFYSRLDHSIGVALIVWNFTHDKKQTLAALFHDVSTPVFSHVVDFLNGDALTQESTEHLTSVFINEDLALSQKLFMDGIYKYEIDDYHKYPVADNEIPGLSADRLEYMYPSGAALDKVWSIKEVKSNYKNIVLLKNEKNEPELGFRNLEEAVRYTKKFCEISLILQHNEDKISMQLLADSLKCALEKKFIREEDLYTMSEKEMIFLLDKKMNEAPDEEFSKLYRTFRGMKEVIHSETPIENAYCISMNVKTRYVDPLVLVNENKEALRCSSLSLEALNVIKDFLSFSDTKYGAVKWL